MTTGELIAHVRESRDVLQKDLAKAINIDPVVLNRIEKGKRPVRGDEIKAIADYFNVSTDYLLGNERDGLKMKLPLKPLRERKGMTQAELGRMLGVTPSAIAMYETGQRTPDGEKIVRLAEIFNVSTDYLLGSERNPQYIFSSEESQLVNGYRALNEVGKRTILSLIGQLTGGVTAGEIKNNRVGEVNGNAYGVRVTGAAM